MRISIIAAMDRAGLIGNDTGLPWRLPHDLRRFRDLTMGKPCIMGRRTLEMIGGPLKGRHNIVLTHQMSYLVRGFSVAHTVPAALAIGQIVARESGVDEIMVIGGAEVYAQFLHMADRLYLTVIDGLFEGNAHFPADWASLSWRVVQTEAVTRDERNPFNHVFTIYDRLRTDSLRLEVSKHHHAENYSAPSV